MPNSEVCTTPPSVSSINRILRTRAAERAAEELQMILSAQHLAAARQQARPAAARILHPPPFPFPMPLVWPGILPSPAQLQFLLNSAALPQLPSAVGSGQGAQVLSDTNVNLSEDDSTGGVNSRRLSRSTFTNG
uniref:Uncharacterized protein n=1 Tax=Caenorhabditis japonica TaxID=281687 RepID=A0A8R1IQD6_CAEJA